MADHEMQMLPGGLVLALHFDNMNLAKTKNLTGSRSASPGLHESRSELRESAVWTRFTHFHDLVMTRTAAGRVRRGVWFVDVGARSFTFPFGKVEACKVDLNFMPTSPPG